MPDNEPTEYRQPRFVPLPGATEFILVRHGESAPARANAPFALVDGHGDPELDPNGRAQAELVGERLAREHVDAIYVTTLRRTHETAAPLAARLGITPVVEPDLREDFLGEWEGGSFRKHVAERHPIAVRMFAEQRWDAIPGAETLDSLRSSPRAAILRFAGRHPDERVVAVVHGGVIGSILGEAVGATQGFAFAGADNASISHLVVMPDRWILRRYNDTSHLESALTVAPEPPT
jgi:probable phosphoglycerate mutase